MPTYQRPLGGQNVDETHLVRLLPDPPSPCVSVRLLDGKVLLSKRQLEAMAYEASAIKKMRETDSTRVTEEQRLRIVSGSRAGNLLKAISEHADESQYLADESKRPRDVDYLLSELLEDGAVAVVSVKTGQLIPEIKVTYKGYRAGPTLGQGMIYFSFDTVNDRGHLLIIDWWVS